jgi:hypothetical protein
MVTILLAGGNKTHDVLGIICEPLLVTVSSNNTPDICEQDSDAGIVLHKEGEDLGGSLVAVC